MIREASSPTGTSIDVSKELMTLLICANFVHYFISAIPVRHNSFGFLYLYLFRCLYGRK